jgi:hypothetical protein
MRSLKEEREITRQRLSIEKPPQDPMKEMLRAIELLCGHSLHSSNNKKYKDDIGFYYRFERTYSSIMNLDPRGLLKEDRENVEFLKSCHSLIYRTGYPSELSLERIQDPNDKRDEVIEAFISLFVSVIREERRFAEEQEVRENEYKAKIDTFDEEHKKE